VTGVPGVSGLAWALADLGFERALLADAGRGLCLVRLGQDGAAEALERWRARRAPEATVEDRDGDPPPGLREARRQLEQYAAGARRALDLELDLRGTPFELEVWGALRRIPFGQTRTYGELARELGRPGAARAVGGAAGRNPVPVVVPCHRLLSGQGLGGFSAGLERKRALLRLEGLSPG
jgi:O-6-methylguanine DNA methyltransferase